MKIRRSTLFFLLILSVNLMYSAVRPQGISEYETLKSRLTEGRQLYFDGRFDDAISFLNNMKVELRLIEESKSIKELKADVHIFVGCSLLGKEEIKEALIEFKEMLSLAPYRRAQITNALYGPKVMKYLKEAETEFEGEIPTLESIGLENEAKNIAGENLENKDSASTNEITNQTNKGIIPNMNLLGKDQVNIKPGIKRPVKFSGKKKNKSFKSNSSKQPSKNLLTKKSKLGVSGKNKKGSRKIVSKTSKTKLKKNTSKSTKKKSSSGKKKVPKSSKKKK